MAQGEPVSTYMCISVVGGIGSGFVSIWRGYSLCDDYCNNESVDTQHTRHDDWHDILDDTFGVIDTQFAHT